MSARVQASVTGVSRGDVTVRSHSEPSVTVVQIGGVALYIGGDTRWEQLDELRQIARAILDRLDELCPECGEKFTSDGVRRCSSCDLDDYFDCDDLESDERPLCEVCEAKMLRTVDRSGTIGHMCPKCDAPERFVVAGAA